MTYVVSGAFKVEVEADSLTEAIRFAKTIALRHAALDFWAEPLYQEFDADRHPSPTGDATSEELAAPI